MKEQLPPEAEAASPKPERTWYGWQTIIADVSGLALIALSSDDAAPGVAGLAILTLGSPIIHAAHLNTKSALISLGIRFASVGLLVLGALFVTDNLFDGGQDDSSAAVGVVSIILGITGGLAAVVVDASLLAYTEYPRKARESQVNLAPLVDPVRGSYGLRFGISL